MDNVRCTYKAKKGQKELYKKTIKLSSQPLSIEEKKAKEIECVMTMNEDLLQACASGKIAASAKFKKIANFKYDLQQNGVETKHLEQLRNLDDSCERLLKILEDREREEEDQGEMKNLRCDLQITNESFLKRNTFNLTPSEMKLGEGVERGQHVECIKAMNQWVFDTCHEVELPEEFSKKALLKYDLVKDGRVQKITKTHNVPASCTDWGIAPPTPEPAPTTPVNPATPESLPPRFPSPTGGKANDFDRSKYAHLCPDGWMDRPAVAGNESWGFYGRTGAVIPWGETRRYCAPVGQPDLLDPSIELERIFFTWGDDTDYECGVLDVVAQQAFPPYIKQGPSWGTSGSLRFQGFSRNTECPECVQRGVYIVTVHVRRLFNPVDPRCNKFGLAWRPAYTR